MIDAVGWLTPLVVLVGGALLGLLGWAVVRRSGRNLATSRGRVFCPAHRRPIEVILVRDLRRGRWTGVRACNAFGDPTEVTCGRRCVDAINRSSTPFEIIGSPAA